MKRSPAECVVNLLGFSDDRSENVDALRKLSRREWEFVLRWLNDASMAFYLLRKLKERNATETVPPWVMARLQRSFAANQLRIADMAHQFGVLNQKFNDAGVRYAVLKGFSLVPEFCPDADLRHQGDIDYLVDEPSLLEAQRVVLEAGYIRKVSASSQELVFILPGMGEPSHDPEQYYARGPHAVELHLDIWDSEYDRVRMKKLFSVEQAGTQHWNGFVFPALADEDAFLVQVLHACHHVFNYWLRTACLLEIGYFLNRRLDDTSLWNQVEQRVGDNLVLREFVVVVTELAANLFRSPVPPVVRKWGSRIRSGPRVWIDRYARHWALSEMPTHSSSLFPGAKLALFLHQQYKDDTIAPTISTQDRLMTHSRLVRIASSIKNNPSIVLDTEWRRRQLLIRRSLFHVLSQLRYLYEIPRWRWLNRAAARSSSMEV
jgi:hypothetical protein